MLAAAIGLLALLPALPVYAAPDTVTIYGAPFPVDDLTPTDSNNVRVTIGVDTQIVQRSSLPDFVLLHTVQNPSRSRRVPLSALQKFIQNALADGNAKRAAWGIRALTAHVETDEVTVRDEISALAWRPDAVEALKILVNTAHDVPSQLLARIAVGVGARDPGWLKARMADFALPLQAQVREELRRETLSAIRAHEFMKVEQLLGVQAIVFGESDPGYKDMSVLYSRLKDALDRAASGDMEGLFTLYEVSRNNPEFIDLIAPFVLEAVHHEAKAELDKGEVTRALLLLSRLDFSRRTPQTHELTKRALGACAGSVDSPLGNSSIALFLRRMSLADEAVKHGYVDALERQIHFLLSAGQVESVGDYLERLVQVRPDPSYANDSLRMDEAIAFLRRGMRLSARAVVSQIMTGVGVGGYFTLAGNGYFGDPFNWLVAGVIIGILSLLLWVRIHTRERLAAREYARETAREDEEEEDDADRPIGFTISGSRLMSPAMQEYNRCLQTLGLKPGTPLRQIKSHYRSLIKSVHPDLNKNLSASEKERFVTLTKTYDRLMELRRELKFPE